MSKIFEALEHARRETSTHDEVQDDDFINDSNHAFVELEATAEPRQVDRGAVLELLHKPLELEPEHDELFVEEPEVRDVEAATDYHFEAEEEISALYLRIDALLPLNTRRIIQFIGPQGEEDISSIARGFAFAAVRSGKTVLLVEGDQKNRNQRRFFDIKNNVSWINAVQGGSVSQEAIHQIGDTSLFVCANGDTRHSMQQTALPKSFQAFAQAVDHSYDLVVIDSSPIQKTSDGLLISPMTDGIVLVVEANKTLGDSAEEIKNRLVRSGGNLLGVVVSREKHYLPKLLARLMYPNRWHR